LIASSTKAIAKAINSRLRLIYALRAERLLKARLFRAARALRGTVLREEQLRLLDARNVDLHEAGELVGKIDVLQFVSVRNDTRPM